jgi:2-dehydropantoate 2-reductase
VKEVPGVPRAGGSTLQSLLRGAGSVETDYLNGEIVYLGRLHGVATPVNAVMMRVAARLAREGAKPGQMTLADLQAEIADNS